MLVRLNRDPVGTGRPLATGKIGRLAVLSSTRRLGIAGVMPGRLVQLALDRGLDGDYLHAQATALEFFGAQVSTADGPG